MSTAAELKDAGNKAFTSKNYTEALDLFSKAIELDANNHVLWSNRSGAKAALKDWSGALEDAEQTVKLNPKWAKGYARKGAALHGAGRLDEAVVAYEEGIAIDDSPALQKGLKEAKDAQAHAQTSDSGADPISKLFQDPNLLGKLASNPKTQSYMADPSFVNQLRLMQSNPLLAQSALQDPRMITVLGVLMGIDMQGFERPEGSNEMPPGFTATPQESTPPPSPPKPAPKQADPPSKPTKAAPTPAKEETMEVDDESEPGKKDALAFKAKGAEAYKKRDFPTAKDAFSKAWETWPKDISFLTNLAAVEFEMGDYDGAIATCNKAIEEGHEIRADYKLIAKAYGRIGTAYLKKDDLAQAITFFNKSLTEHRTPDILNKLRDAEKLKKERDRTAYINPEEADKAREEGNTFFKAGDYAGAVKAYTEAINRAPDDPRGYNNRANAYTKLMALPEALKDAEKAIEVDPKFIKAHIRKTLVLFSMREYTRAMEAAQEALDQDDEKKHTAEIEGLLTKCSQALYSERSSETEEQTLQRAMRDPEVANIMTDPVMQQILQQAQTDPASLQDHLKNPMVRAKIQKLIAAGIIKTR